MSGFRVFMKPGGWRITNGDREHGPYPTYVQALRSAENLNLQYRIEEHRSFAPVEPTDPPVGDVLDNPDTPPVWETLESQPKGEPADTERVAREAVERARVGGADSPAAGAASLGGGVV